MSSIDNETKKMLLEFVSESLDSLDTNEAYIDSLAQDDNIEEVNTIFRAFHTIKGLSGFFEMMIINKVTHEAETLLDIVRKQNKPQDENIINLVYKSFDFLRDILAVVSSDFSDLSMESEAELMKTELKEMIISIESGVSPQTVEPTQEVEIPTDDINLDDTEITAETNAVVEENDSLITDEMSVQYLTSATELVEIVENSLLNLEEDPNQPDLVVEAFGSVHSLKGNSGFMGFSEIEALSSDIENILDSVKTGELEIDENIITILLSNIEVIKNRLGSIADGTLKSSIEQQSEIASPEPEIIQEEIIPQKQDKPDTTENEIKIELADNDDISNTTISADKPKPVKSTNKIQKAEEKDKSKDEKSKLFKRQDLRVETTKIDKLFDLVGELITIESMITKSPDLEGLDLPQFNKSANILNKITRELQEISMSIRMTPIEGLFNKMKRLVRDVSVKQHKKVNLSISGQETEMDKNVIDEISDPLVHILRNACDHGVETPEVRKEAGKDEQGKINLSAKYEGNEILIIIEDDGKGIDRDIILNKAIEKGLIDTDGSELTDQEVFMMIFEPGFSTAQTVTDISGRGVGMDVVKKNLEKLQGTIDVYSKLGLGSTFILRIPLTLAIMEAMLISIGDAVFALPILALRESFICDMENINKTMDGLEVVNIRNEIMPVIRLHEILNIEPKSHNLDEGIMIIIETREKKVCLFADSILGQQQAVIKTLGDFIGKVAGITGCMVLGDGSIGLILDIESLIKLSENYEIVSQ